MTPDLIRFGWDNGDLSPKLRNLQKQLRIEWTTAKKNSRKWYLECSRRLGKSTFFLMMLTEACLKKPGTRCLFVAPVAVALEKYLEPILNQVYFDSPSHLRPELDSKMILTFPNGSVIHFTGSNGKSYNSKRGNEYDIAAIDEARDIDNLEELIESVVMPALLMTNGYLIMASTPADSEDHPLYQYKQQAEKEGWYSHYTIFDAQKWDPIAYPMERIEEWKQETRSIDYWEREYLAKWVRNINSVIVPEWKKEYITEVDHDQFFRYYHKYSSIDWGVRDNTACIFGYYDFKKGKLVVEDEFILHGEQVRTDKIAETVKTKERTLDYQVYHDTADKKYQMMNPYEKMYRRIADNSNPLIINDLNVMYHLTFTPTTKDNLQAMIAEVRVWINNGRVAINPRCKELIGCLENAIWDLHREKFAHSKVYGHFDALAALMYLIRGINQTTNPIPSQAEINPYLQFVKPGSDTEHQLAVSLGLIKDPINFDQYSR